jgi:hypothetical protein
VGHLTSGEPNTLIAVTVSVHVRAAFDVPGRYALKKQLFNWHVSELRSPGLLVARGHGVERVRHGVERVRLLTVVSVAVTIAHGPQRLHRVGGVALVITGSTAV